MNVLSLLGKARQAVHGKLLRGLAMLVDARSVIARNAMQAELGCVRKCSFGSGWCSNASFGEAVKAVFCLLCCCLLRSFLDC